MNQLNRTPTPLDRLAYPSRPVLGANLKKWIRLSAICALLAGVLLPALSFAQPVAAQSEPCDLANALWIGTAGHGFSCVDGSGFHTYSVADGFSSSEGVAVCKEGVYILDGLSFKLFDGKTFKDLPASSNIGAQNVSCAGDGKLWASFLDSVSYFDGAKWTNYKKQFGSGPFSSMVKKVVAGPNGTAWVLTNGSVSNFDGSNWTVYEQGKGLNTEDTFDDLVVDGKGQPWVIAGSGLLTFDGKSWKTITNNAASGATALTIDTNGKLWVGTTKGLAAYDGSKWTTYNHKNSKISSQVIRSVSVDAQGRAWVGTDYGLDLFDGKAWKTYLMSNSPLLDNTVFFLSVTGKGPTMPPTQDKKPGSITGIIMSGKNPVAGATFQLCTEFVGGVFEGETPCGDNPYTQSVKTDDKGIYTLNNVPVGRYGFVVQDQDGNWFQFFGAASRIEVKEGQSTELPALDISQTS